MNSNRDDSSLHARLTESAILNPQSSILSGQASHLRVKPRREASEWRFNCRHVHTPPAALGRDASHYREEFTLKKPTRWGTHSRTLNKDGFAATLSACTGHSKVSSEKSGPRHEPKIVNQPPTLVHSSAPKCLSVNPAVRRKPYFSDALMSMIFRQQCYRGEKRLSVVGGRRDDR